jgi:glycosyltransferase involved in cell wall biosynthesis
VGGPLPQPLNISRTVAVAIPAFNAEATLARALSSIEAQTRLPDEVIVVDDGSTDRTLALAREFAAASQLRIRVIVQENGGAASARNAAVKAASADLIALLDADDEFKPHALELMADMHAAFPDAVLAFGDSERYDGEIVKNASFLEPRLAGVRDIEPQGRFNILHHPFRHIVEGNFVAAGSYMVVRQTFLDVGGCNTSLRRAIDRDFFMRLATAGQWVFSWEKLSRVHYTTGSLNHVQNAGAHAENVLGILCGYARDMKLAKEDRRRLERAIRGSARALFYWAGADGPSAIARARGRFPDLAGRLDIAVVAQLEMLRCRLRALRDHRIASA